MTTNYDKLRQLQPLSHQELYAYMARHSPDAVLRIITRSGQSHFGCVLHFGQTSGGEDIVVVQILDSKGREECTMMHIALSQIESTEFLTQDGMKVLSTGIFRGVETYEIIGMPPLLQQLKELEQTLLYTADTAFGIAEMNYYGNGRKRDRLLQTTQIILQALLALFRQHNALATWKQKYKVMQLEEGDALKVTAQGDKVLMQFPFMDLSQPMPEQDELMQLFIHQLEVSE